MKKILVLIVIFGVFSSFSIKAETTSSWYNKFYVGAGVGFFPGKFDSEFNNKTSLPFEGHIANNDLNGFIGYDLFSFLALEVGYSYFLERKINKKRGQYAYNANKLYVNSVFKYQFNKHTPFLIFGIGTVNFEEKWFMKVSNTVKYERKGLSYILGLGYEYALTTHNNIGITYTYNILPKLDFKETSTIGYYYQKNNAEKMNYSNIGVFYKYSF